MPKQMGWVRFEGPGKLHAHHWHRVTSSPMVPFVTFCGRYVRDEHVSQVRGEGVECLSCKRVAGKGGGYL